MSMTLIGRLPYRAVLAYERVRDERGPRPDGLRHHALALLLGPAAPEPKLRLWAGGRGQSEAVDALELGRLPDHVREHRGLAPGVGGGAVVGARPRPLARRAHAGAGARLRRGLRAVLDSGTDGPLRGVRRRSVELVHPALAAAVLERRPGGARDPVVVDRPGAPGRLAGDAVSRRPPLAHA